MKIGFAILRHDLKTYNTLSVGLSGATSLSAGLVTAPLHWQDPAKQYMAKHSLDLYADLYQTSDFS